MVVLFPIETWGPTTELVNVTLSPIKHGSIITELLFVKFPSMMFLLSKMKIQRLDLFDLMSKERLNIYLLILFLEKKVWQKNYLS